MGTDFFDKLEALNETAKTGADENDIRDNFQKLFDDLNGKSSTAKEEKYLAALAALKKYYNRIYTSDDYFPEKQTVDAGELLEALVFCCDILCKEWGKRIFLLNRPLGKVNISNEKLLIWAVLELISNAVVFSRGKYIGVSAAVSGNVLKVKVENFGSFPKAVFCESSAKGDGGLRCVNEIARKLGGTLLMSENTISGKNMTNLLLSADVSKGEISKGTEKLNSVNDYISLFLDDRLSPVYVSLSELL